MARWQRTLTVTAVAQVFSIVGFNFVVPFLPLYIQKLGVHGPGRVTFWAALLSGGTALSMAITAPIWGVLADRHGRKIMVTRSMLSAAIIIGLMGVAQNVYQLLALRLIQGAFTGTISASQALVASQSPKERLGLSMGIMQTAVFTGASLGPLAGGIAGDAFGFRASFLVAAAFLLSGGLLVLILVHEERRDTGAASRPFWEGIGDVVRAPALLAMIAAVFAVEFALTCVIPVLPQFIQQLQGRAGHAAAVTGAIFAGAGLAGALSSVSVGAVADRVGSRTILVAGASVGALLSVPQFFVQATWQIAVLRVLIGFAVGAMLPSSSALLARLVKPERRGTAYGLSGSASSLGFGLGPLTAAAVVGLAGMRFVFLTAAALLCVIACWVAFMVHVPDEALPEAQGERQARTRESERSSVVASPRRAP